VRETTRGDVMLTSVTLDVGVEESNLDTVLVEERGGEGTSSCWERK